MANKEKTERGISIMVFICWTTQELWDMEKAELERHRINHITPEIMKKFQKKTTPTSNVIRHSISSDLDLFLVPENIFWNEGATQTGVDSVQAGLLNMSEQEEILGADCLAHVFWGVLDNFCRQFSNPLSP